jgi:type VI secretion system protein ImpA
MASAPVLDIAELLAPISESSPAGSPMSYELRRKLDEARKEEEPDPEDPSRPPVPKQADWSGIIRTGAEQLTSKSKDLQIAVRMTEALTKQHGFAGLRDGLHLLRALVEECGERLHPTPEEGETLEVRADVLYWLSDEGRGARFPNTIRDLKVLAIDDEKYSWLDKRRAEENRGPIDAGAFQRVKLVSPEVAEDTAQAVEEFQRLEQVLNEKLGDHAPSLLGLQQALDDCNRLVQHLARQQAGADGEAAEPGGAEAAAGALSGFAPGDLSRPVATRAEAYRQLARVANVLEQLEPHSPIPDLIRRAVELGRMPFRELVRELIRDPAQLAELRREFGIKETASEGTSEAGGSVE